MARRVRAVCYSAVMRDPPGSCPADGFPPGGAGAAPQGWRPAGHPRGRAANPPRGFSRRPKPRSAGGGARRLRGAVPALVLRTFTGTPDPGFFWPGFFPEGLRAVIFRPRIRGGALPALPASSGLVAGCPPGSRGGGNRARPFPAVLSVRARQKLPSEPDPSGRGLVPRLNRRARGEGKRALPAEQPGPGQRCRRLGRPRPPQRPSAGSRSRPGPRPRGVGSAGGAGVGDWDRLEMHAGGSDRSSPLFPSSKTGAAEEGEFPAVPLAWIRGSLRWEPSSPSALRPWLRGPSPLRPPQGGSAAGRPR